MFLNQCFYSVAGIECLKSTVNWVYSLSTLSSALVDAMPLLFSAVQR